MGEIWLSLLWAVICCVLVIGLAYWFTKYVVGRGKLGSLGMSRRTDGIEVLTQMPLGKEQRLLVVKAAGRYFLLGATAAGISCLAEFTPEEAQVWCSEHTDPAQQRPPSFTEALQKVLKEKWRG